MKRARWGCCSDSAPRMRAAFVAVLLVLFSSAVQAGLQEFGNAWVLETADETPPAQGRSWQRVEVPRVSSSGRFPADRAVDWIRIEFDWHSVADANTTWAVYLPYLVAGGKLWINGSPLADVPSTTSTMHARWERPFLLPVPAESLHDGTNELLVRPAIDTDSRSTRFSRVVIGALDELLPLYERRLFWTRTMPQITTVVCLLVAGFVLFIWWRRRSEVLYGLFGLAAALWGVRTLTFVVELLPTRQWDLWRLIVLCATIGFVVVLALFTLRLSSVHKPWVERLFLSYWLAGPLLLVMLGTAAEPLVNRLWTGGLIPIGIAMMVVALRTVWHQRTARSAALPLALGIALLAGIHDWLTVWHPNVVGHLVPQWAGDRIFLLYHAANFLLLTMGGLLTLRFIETVSDLEQLNATLEARVADRERALAANYEQLAALQRERAAAEERQLIMRDLHDGLGSRLFTSLLRVERGDMNEAQIASVLRDCIADMRLTLDALASQSSDVGSALANFMFRWETLLRAADVQPHWDIDTGLDAHDLAPHDALQLLRIAQEALTNVLKHAQATQVEVRLARHDDELLLEIEDNGAGLAGRPAPHSHGIPNMQSRAARLGGRIELRSSDRGTCVALHLHRPAHASRSARMSGLQAPAPVEQKEDVAVQPPQAGPTRSRRAGRPAQTIALVHGELPKGPSS